jgi:hypothetical protein
MEKATDLLKQFGGTEAGKQALSSGDIAAGLKEALRVGTAAVVSRLGMRDGFNADPAVHIPLPEKLKPVQSALQKVGMASMLNDLETRLNRAAEAATPKAKELFWKAITEMTINDVTGIYKGPEDAATRYFQGKMTQPLTESMRPVVDRTLSEVGAIHAYEEAMGQYRSLPFVPDVKADLTAYVIDKGLDGIFHYLALEEAAIRKDPAKQTTELLKRVFGK